MAARDDLKKSRDANPDPITGEPGSHPAGVGLGAAAGGAAAGAAAGAVAGPVGAAAGAIVGGLAGGLAGKGIAEQIDPTTEDAYWRDEYPKRDYYDDELAYEDVAPAYRHGELAWERARQASKDAWDRIERAMPGDADNDGR
jgi:hypothetical protein